ncbi:Protease HtpX [Pseudovibrio axinellae]|uniref:Protease HtpX n=1 Tax=Pseudovibrio axinellae TaxID=989403 RepID=A0A165ZZH9_9HYPH|nr:M48 family metalloprotease [Pseudovibrio axinellae]KZL20435.1 Protease HtpX [Pseudovibrio axinellae]SER77228.1 Zn-dependent protease with chaperone function [Pseudovibrio axinellae]
MRRVFRHIAIDLSWFISWSIIAFTAHVALLWAAIPFSFILRAFTDFPALNQDEWSVIVALAQVALFWLILRVPGLIEFFNDIELGARQPSQRELLQIEPAFEYLQEIADAKAVKLPHIVWRVIDRRNYNACAFGRNRIALFQGALFDTKFRKRGLEELAALMAHEIGHLRHWDTVHTCITTALLWPFLLLVKLNNQVCNLPLIGLFFSFIVLPCNLIIMIATKATNLTSRMAEYRADEFAQKLLGKERMCEVFSSLCEERSGTDILAHYLNSHPPTELRRNNLLQRSDYRPQFNAPPASDLIDRFQKH